jgi:O-acetyl-ADP-ribose deacetylase (regulator of RNase III)
MKIIQGDLIKLALEHEFDVIVHGCNCFCEMGGGIANSIKKVFPAAFEEDLKTETGARSKLGDISWTEIEFSFGKLIIVNGYTQYSYRGEGIKIDYDAARSVFKKIKTNFSGLKIGYPAIGAGFGGGDWAKISQIIDEELIGEDHTFVEFKK